MTSRAGEAGQDRPTKISFVYSSPAAPAAIRTMKRNFTDALRLPLGEYITLETERHRARFTGPEAAATRARLAARGDRIRSQR